MTGTSGRNRRRVRGSQTAKGRAWAGGHPRGRRLLDAIKPDIPCSRPSRDEDT